MAGRPPKYPREELLQRAIEVFWSQGFDGASLHDLTEACGVGPSSLYRAFGSKEGLYREALTHYQDTTSGFAATALGQPTLPEVTQVLLAGAAHTFTREGCPRGCAVLSAHRRVGDDADAVVGELRNRTREALLARCRVAEEQGELPPGAAEGVARMLFVWMSGMSQLARDGAAREELLAIADDAAELIAARCQVP